MRALVVCILVVALSVGLGLVTGLYGGAYTVSMLALLGSVLRPLASSVGLKLQLGPQGGIVVVFWIEVIVFAAQAYALYLARRRLRNIYVMALTSWTAIYLLLFCSGSWTDWL